MLTYTLSVSNTGPDPATGVTVIDTLPSGVTFGSASWTGTSTGTCPQAGGTVTCAIGGLASGASVTITITVTPTVSAAPSITNTASITGDQADPTPGNNTASATTMVNPSADLSITKADAPDPVVVNNTLTYTVTVTNNGPSPATGVAVSDTLPAGVTFVSVTPGSPTCTEASGTVTCSLGTLANGASTTVTIVVTVNVTGPFANTATVSAVEPDPNMGNNSATTQTNGDLSRLINISSRARVLTGNDVLIGGFIISGTTPKTVLLRARGPSMGGAPFNIPGVLANPTMQLYSGATVIAQNNDWQVTDPLCGTPATACGNATQIRATAMDPCQPNPGQSVAPPGCSQESAILVTLPPGGYTTIVSGVGGGTGVGLVEVFEADTITTARLINISSRSRVETADNVLIGGLIIGGTTPKTVLLRARGPSMGGAPFNIPGVLANPTMQLYSGATVITQNDNWQTTDPLCGSPATACGDGTQIAATVMDPCQPNPGQSVAPPGCSQESAILVTLPPGGYTTIVSGVGGGVGVGLVEVFEVP